jgi:YbbR domain-containing protein
MASRNFILHNFGWKLLSLFLAVLTWLTIETEFQRQARSNEEKREAPLTTSVRKTFPTIAITLLTAPANTNHFRIYPETAQIDVGGDTQELGLLNSRDVQAFVDLSDVQDEKQFRKPVQVRLPREFSLVGVDPTNVSVERITVVR